jgi:hypothetical protein
MAKLSSKQLNTKLTGSYTFSGSAHSFIGNITADNNISGSATSTGSFGRLQVAGNSSLTGDLTLGGNIQIGDADTDSITISSDLTSNLIPNTDSTYDIGSTTKNWKFGHIEQVSATHVTASGNISGSSTSTGSFGYLEGVSFGTTAQSNITGSFSAASSSFATTTTQNQARLDTLQQFSGSYATTGSNTFIGDQILSGSVYLTGSNHVSGTIRINSEGTYSSSTAIFTNNITNGYPTSNPWGSNLAGSYFNNFDNTTNVSEILRFMSGVISHSLDVADAAPNTKTFASVDTNESNKGNTDSVDGYLPQSYDSTNATMKYLYTKDFVNEGGTIFSGISSYHDNGGTYFIDLDSNSGGSTTVSSSVDTELFGMGGLSSGGANAFKVRVSATQSFSDTGSVSAPTAASNTYTTQSRLDLTNSTFSTTSGITLTKIATNVPAVIPAAYQDGKFIDIGGASQSSGSLSRKYHATKGLFTSVSSSGYYRFHDLKVAMASGSGNYQFVDGATKTHFWAPIDQIESDIGTNSLSIAQVTQSYLTATSRSLSGTPYLIGATYHISASVRGLFHPMYAASTTIVDDTIGSVGVGSVAGSGIDDVSTSGGTISTANAVFASDSGSVRATSAIPTRTDVVRFNATYTLSGTTGENISQTGVSDSTYTVGVRGRNRASSQSTLQTSTIFYHSASTFSQPATSGSLGVFQRAQGYDGGALQGTTETFTGEDFRIALADNVQTFNGTAFTTTYNVSRSSPLLGNYDLQVKPGYLVDPGGTYRYWYPSSYGTGTYKYYIRRFQTDGTTYSSMTVNLNNNTLIAWNATTNGISCALLFESSGNGSGNTSELSVARIYDPVKITSNLIEADMAADNFKNPFSTAISLYGNSGGSIGSNTYTIPIRNADGMYLDSNDNELYVIVRYKGDPTPIDDITLTFS